MRRMILLVAALILVASAVAAAADEFLELEGLHLLAWEDLPEGTPALAGPLSSAVLMAWHADNGYPRLLPDLNGDGRIDEADTVELAIEFADQMIRFDGPTWDPSVVDVLAQYVADHYPGTFELWVYDPSLPGEFLGHLGRPFDPGAYPGIEVLLLEEPNHPAYVEHLERRRPGIVGIGFEPEPNDFCVSRSAVLAEEAGAWPVDLVNTSHEAFGPDPIWNTLLGEEFGSWLFDRGEWMPFEVFIVLVPVQEGKGEAEGEPGDPFEPGNGPGGDPGGDPGDPGRDPGDPFDPGGGDQPRDPTYPRGDSGDPREPFDPLDPEEFFPCCFPDGTCQILTAESCFELGGSIQYGAASCQEADCPAQTGDCASVDGEITAICYTYENGVLRVYASYAIRNHSPVDAKDITAYGLVGLNDGINGLGGGPDSQDWKYGLDIPANSSYTYDVVYTASAPNLDLSNLTYLYGSLWLQKEAPWDCWPITRQAWVNAWDPAPRCHPSGTPPGGEDGGDPVGEPPGGSEGEPSGGLPNLWVTNVGGGWTWSDDGREHAIATAGGTIHNGGQATAVDVRAKIKVGGRSKTVTVGTLSPGQQKSVTATFDLGSYDSVSWPVKVTVTADPTNSIAEADESNNETKSAIPRGS